MRQVITSTVRVIGQAAGILAAVAWGWTCWRLLAQPGDDITSLEIRWGYRGVALAAASILIVGFLVHTAFAALADRIAPSARKVD
jgi:hypothetical protein